MPKRKVVRFREFLNTVEHGGTALVSFEASISKTGYVSGEFSVKDCNETATLEFYVPGDVRRGKPRVENALRKIATMKAAIEQFEEAYLQMLDDRAKFLKSKAKKAKKKRKAKG